MGLPLGKCICKDHSMRPIKKELKAPIMPNFYSSNSPTLIVLIFPPPQKRGGGAEDDKIIN